MIKSILLILVAFSAQAFCAEVEKSRLQFVVTDSSGEEMNIHEFFKLNSLGRPVLSLSSRAPEDPNQKCYTRDSWFDPYYPKTEYKKIKIDKSGVALVQDNYGRCNMKIFEMGLSSVDKSRAEPETHIGSIKIGGTTRSLDMYCITLPNHAGLACESTGYLAPLRPGQDYKIQLIMR